SIELDSSTAKGLYKIVYASPPETNNFDFIYNGGESIVFRFSEEKGLEFEESKENKMWISYQHSMEMVNQTISNYYTQKSEDQEAFHSIFKTLKDTQSAFEEASENLMVSAFIKSNTPYIPVVYEDLSTYKNNLKHHYLQPVDFGNPLVQSSDFVIDRVMGFVFGMVDKNSEYKEQVDILVNEIGPGEKVIELILLEMVWRNFKNMENTELANYVSDNYLMELSKQFKYEDLTNKLMAYKNTSIGQKAIDFEISQSDKKLANSLHDLDVAENYLLVFWSSTCSHCLEELPKVRNLLKSNEDFKVIAFGMEDGDATFWKEKITQFPDFIHVLGTGKWDNPVSKAYGIEATPTYFLLDKDKTIKAKPEDFDALVNILK
ncbi:MAG: TlpA disulfide reductase family protein, partial [Bacteroidota bacterium]